MWGAFGSLDNRNCSLNNSTLIDGIIPKHKKQSLQKTNNSAINNLLWFMLHVSVGASEYYASIISTLLNVFP